LGKVLPVSLNVHCIIRNKGVFLTLLLGLLVLSTTASAAEAVNGLAMHGKPKYVDGFANFAYVNPDAPKGGELKMAEIGTFDNLNPYIIKGTSAPGVGIIFQTLMVKSEDEAFSEYGLIAKTVEVADDRSEVTFNLRKNAKWNDGKPLTAEDVVFSFNILMEKGHPFYRSYYAHVKEVKAENQYRVKFTFDMKGNMELPLIMGELPILPKHYWEGKEFDKTTLEPPLGSGPYRIKEVEAGRKIVYERVKDWWADDLAVNKGRYNFDTIVYEMYRDESVILQGLFAGNYDIRNENIAKAWEVEYNVPAVKDGLIKKEHIKHKLTSGMQAFVFNARRALFQDKKVREALNYAFDFEWSNKQFAYGNYKRTNSYFVNSELAASGVPQGKELEILSQFEDQLPSELFMQEFKLPQTSGSGTDTRSMLAKAMNLLHEAGWKLGESGLLEKDGLQFKFEILVYSPIFDRWINPMIANLKKLGIEATLRIVDTTQYQKRMENFDFDIIIHTFLQSLSPGNEQRDYWSSDKADIIGSRNVIGIKNPVVDKLIPLLVSAPSREDLIAATRALDRVLLWNYYVIPNWYIDYYRVACWDKFGKPEISPEYGLAIVDTWWYDQAKADNIANKVKN